MSQPFDFSDDDVRVREIVVTLGAKGKFTLREADEETACMYRNIAMDKTVLKDGKVSGVSGFADLEPMLVGQCLFDSNGVQVGSDFVRKLPARIVKPLFNWIQDNSDMKNKEEEDGKGKR